MGPCLHGFTNPCNRMAVFPGRPAWHDSPCFLVVLPLDRIPVFVLHYLFKLIATLASIRKARRYAVAGRHGARRRRGCREIQPGVHRLSLNRSASVCLALKRERVPDPFRNGKPTQGCSGALRGLIGNPVRIGDGPAAVTPLRCNAGKPFSTFGPLFRLNRNGKVAGRAGKSEDLPEYEA